MDSNQPETDRGTHRKNREWGHLVFQVGACGGLALLLGFMLVVAPRDPRMTRGDYLSGMALVAWCAATAFAGAGQFLRRAWADRLALVLCAVAGLGIAGIFLEDSVRNLCEQPARPGWSATILVLVSAWLLGAVLGVVLAAISALKGRKEAIGGILQMAFGWPFLVGWAVIQEKMFIVLVAGTIGLVHLGEIAGRHWGHPVAGALAGLGTVVAAFGLFVSWGSSRERS